MVDSSQQPTEPVQLSGYLKSISQATAVTVRADLFEIEQVMRDTIFHSTLDWQDTRTFARGREGHHRNAVWWW